MRKRQVFLLILELFVLSIALYFTFNSQDFNKGLTGFAIYDNTPNATTSKDTYIRNNSETNYSTASVLKVGKTAAGAEFRSLIEFNVSSIPDSNTVTSAKVQIYLAYASNNSANMTIRAYRLTSAWSSIATTWNNSTASSAWSTPGGTYDSTLLDTISVGNATLPYNISITTAARGWVNGSYSNFGIILIAYNISDGDYKDFNSSESDSNDTRPRIFVDYTENAAPTINESYTIANSSNLKNVGEYVTFVVNWSDLEGNDAKAYVCNTTNISVNYGCGNEKTYCNTTLGQTNPINCNHTANISDNRSNPFYVSVCDATNCSSVTAVQYFYVNHFPNNSLLYPNGGETVNQSNGNYAIRFNVSDQDADRLFANIYYGISQNSTNYSIVNNLNLTAYCSDGDSTTSTTNNCSYSWNSSGIYGDYFLTIIVNDTYSLTNDSSTYLFYVRSIEDSVPPNITYQWIDSDISSGQLVNIYANISDPNMQTAWISINITPQVNLTMTNTSAENYNVSWTATYIGSYSFKVYARDLLGNLNDSNSWTEFNISKPYATTQNESSAPVALPMSVVKVTGQLNATNQLKNVYAYLNTPYGFDFMTTYPQNLSMGNFTNNQTKNATWFLSVPLTEGNYTLNISYADYYSNGWNSSNTYVNVTSAIGGGGNNYYITNNTTVYYNNSYYYNTTFYFVRLNGYPEVETSHNYYVEAYFLKDGAYEDADSVYLKIYDASGTLTAGPVAITNISTGKYNYTYAVGASVTEGIWKTSVNATKNGTSYFMDQFWKVVGGPFDVRNIVVDDNVIPNLGVSVTTENTGGAIKDLTLVWNLTREDTGAVLNSGSDTFAVNPYSTRVWSVAPYTTYEGNVRITFLGFYSGTEKAGAYLIFNTSANGTTPPVTPPSGGGSSGGGGGGGGAVIPAAEYEDFKISSLERIVYVTRGVEKLVYFEVYNNGTKDLKNISLTLENLNSSYYSLTPSSITSLGKGESAKFEIKFLISDATLKEKDFVYRVDSGNITKSENAKLIVMSMADYFLNEIKKLKDKINLLKDKITSKSLLEDLKGCEKILSEVANDVREENFINAEDGLKNTDDCINDVEDKLKKEVPVSKISMAESSIVIITWGMILILIIAIAVLIYLIYRKFNILSLYKEEKPLQTEVKELKQEDFEAKIKNIEDKLKRLGP